MDKSFRAFGDTLGSIITGSMISDFKAAPRGTLIHVKNATDTEFVLDCSQLDHGIWLHEYPGPGAHISYEPFTTMVLGSEMAIAGISAELEMFGMGTGTKGRVRYIAKGDVSKNFYIDWNNPFLGDNSTFLNAAKVGIERVGSDTGNHAQFRVVINHLSSPVYFLKTHHTRSGSVQIQQAIIPSASKVAISGTDLVKGSLIAISAADASNGTWMVYNQDVYFIKLKNTGSPNHKIEVHRLSHHTGWKELDIRSIDWFDVHDSDTGFFTLDHEDIWFIRTKNAASGKIEVLTAPRANDSYYASLEKVYGRVCPGWPTLTHSLQNT